MASFGVGPNPYKPVKPLTADALTQETLNYWIKAMTLNEPWQQAQSASYQAAQNPNYNNINTQSPIPFPGVWQGGEQPAIVSPFIDWDGVVWVVSKIDGEGNGYVRAVFSTEKEADLYAANVNCDEYEYMDITPHKLDSEVPVNEPKE